MGGGGGGLRKLLAARQCPPAASPICRDRRASGDHRLVQLEPQCRPSERRHLAGDRLAALGCPFQRRNGPALARSRARHHAPPATQAGASKAALRKRGSEELSGSGSGFGAGWFWARLWGWRDTQNQEHTETMQNSHNPEGPCSTGARRIGIHTYTEIIRNPCIRVD